MIRQPYCLDNWLRGFGEDPVDVSEDLTEGRDGVVAGLDGVAAGHFLVHYLV